MSVAVRGLMRPYLRVCAAGSEKDKALFRWERHPQGRSLDTSDLIPMGDADDVELHAVRDRPADVSAATCRSPDNVSAPAARDRRPRRPPPFGLGDPHEGVGLGPGAFGV